MSSYFSTTHLFSVSYEFVLSLVEKSPFMLLKCLFKGSERAFKGSERTFKGFEPGRTHQNAFASKSFDR